MAGTNAVVFKTALLAVLKAALPTVRVDDAYNGKLAEREYVYIGHFVGPMQPLTFRNGGRLPRREDLTVQIHVEVINPAGTTFDTDTRATAIGQAIEEAIAADPQFGGTVPGLLAAYVNNVKITPFYTDDESAVTELVYDVTVSSKLG